MPTRLLREYLDSENVNRLDAEQERHFVRIIQKADDYGRLTANPKLLRPLLYPLLLDQVREADVQRWNAACAIAGIIRLYSVEGKQYLVVVNFKQRTRTASKYPAPLDDDGQMTVKCPHVRRQMTAQAEAEAEAYYEGGVKNPPLSPQPAKSRGGGPREARMAEQVRNIARSVVKTDA